MSFTRAIKPTDHITVLQAVGARMIAQLATQFNEKNVLYTLEVDLDGATSHNLIATITPMDGVYQPELAGGGKNVCIEQTGVLITLWSRQVTDKKGSAEHVLLGVGEDSERSMLKIKHLILKTFAGHMLLDPQDQQPILTEHMEPVSAKTPRLENMERLGKMASLPLGFSLAFQWDLS